MTVKHNLMKLFPLLLAGGLLIGIISNIVAPINVKESCLVVIISVILWYLWPYFKVKTNQLSQKTVTWCIGIGIILIFIIQLIVLRYLPATIYHDPFRVLYQAEHLSQGQHVWSSSTYFWRYPNNVPLAFLLSQWLKLTTFIHLSTNTALHILSIVLLDGFILIALSTIRKISRRNSEALAILTFFIVSPFAYTYYLQVFYSDLPILICLMLCFAILERWTSLSKKSKTLNGLLLFGLILIGQLIKPNLIVFVVAIIILMFYLLLNNRKTLVKYLLPLSIILLGFVATISVKTAIDQTVDFSNNTKYELPTTNWIWMSYNPKGNGTYVGADIKKMTQLPTKAARQSYNEKEIPNRIKSLGVTGVVERWVVKVGVLLNVGHIQRSYTGGYIEAPATYQKYQSQLSLLGSLIMRVGFIFIYGLAFMECLSLIIKKHYAINPTRDLAILLAVGYLAFHALVWEAESRYGQPILPLLLFINASLIPEKQTDLTLSKPRSRTFLLSGTLLIAVLVFAVWSKPLLSSKKMLVAGQRSQLSLQYKAKPTWISKNTTISQTVVLNHAATKLSISAPQKTHLYAQLVSIDDHRSYALIHKGSTLILHQKLASGKYKIVLTNKSTNQQKVELVSTQKFKLTPHPLVINQQHFKYRSLIYDFSYHV